MGNRSKTVILFTLFSDNSHLEGMWSVLVLGVQNWLQKNVIICFYDFCRTVTSEKSTTILHTHTGPEPWQQCGPADRAITFATRPLASGFIVEVDVTISHITAQEEVVLQREEARKKEISPGKDHQSVDVGLRLVQKISAETADSFFY